MDIIRASAKADFTFYNKFHRAPSQRLNLVTLTAASSGKAAYNFESLREPELVNKVFVRAEEENKNLGYIPTLTLVSVTTAHRGTDTDGILMSKDCFLTLVDQFDIDPCVFHYIQLDLHGLHIFPNGNGTYTFLVAVTWYELIWSFNPQTLETKAILILWPSPARTYNESLTDFLELLTPQSNLFYTPLALAFAALADVTRSADRLGFCIWLSIYKVQRMTGHGTGSYDGADEGEHHQIDGLMKISKTIGQTLSNIARHLRHMDLADELVAVIEDYSVWRDRFSKVRPNQLGCFDQAISDISAAMQTLKQRILFRKSCLSFLSERARSQSTTVSPQLSSHMQLCLTNGSFG